VKHVLVCGAAGFTNVGDDAILWGMVTQLAEAAGGRAIRVAGGPELGGIAEPLGARPMTYDDRAELARAIEDADLVLLGGGGMLYDFGYDAGLARFVTDPPDRQWLYELAKISAAAAVAGRPVMMYGMGAGPLFTTAARRTARFICERSRAITLRDASSAATLVDCGVPRSRLFLAADPAVLVEPAASEAARRFAEDHGLADVPRPWIALNLRPWYRFGGPGSAREERGDALDRLVERMNEVVAGLRARTGGTVLLVPMQRLYDDDREVLERVGDRQTAPLVEPPASPPEFAAFLGQCDLVLGMRVHALILSLAAGVPFVGISYSDKVSEFARAAGLDDHVQSADDLDVASTLASCEALLSDRDTVRARLQERRTALREAAGLSADLARFLLERDAPRRASAPRPAIAPSRAAAGISVLMQTRPDYREMPGGDVLQLQEVQAILVRGGLTIDLTGEETPDLSGYDLVHTINLDRPEEPYRHCLNALAQGKPIVVSPVHTDMTEFLEWGDTDYWDLPEPGQGLPTPRPAPPPDPVEERRRALRHQQRQAIIDWATVYLPNAELDAEYLGRAFGMDRSRSVVVPHGVAPRFFEARAEPFVEKHGLRDFVICAGRVEKRKNQLALIAALRGTGIPLVIVGQPNPEEYRDLCRRYADDNVRFFDAMSQDELASAFAAAKVHALPSWFEVPGLVSLEAGAAGCNIVSTDRGSARDYLGDMAWYCDPKDIASVRAAVLAALEAPRSDRLREHIGRNFTWQRAAERTREGYQLALALHERVSAAERCEALLEATQRHADWVARLAADRAYEAQRAAAWAREVGDYAQWLREWGRALEERNRELDLRLRSLHEELDRVTSRRLYRWSAGAARVGWAVLRILGVKR
jgi:polysaccharide pyruvyl transferase WcaK-like protein/glycosyltransferase involved in cell wall biosynthesis